MLFDQENFSGLVAAYAAIVATGALALEIRRWFESGAKLNVTYMLDAITFPRESDDKKHIVITVANRGDTATTITNLGFQVYDSYWKRLRGKSSHAFIANRPSQVQPIPYLLEPGGRWMGMCIQSIEVDGLVKSGNLWAEVYATHSDKPISIRLKPSPQPKGKKIEGALPEKNGS